MPHKDSVVQQLRFLLHCPRVLNSRVKLLVALVLTRCSSEIQNHTGINSLFSCRAIKNMLFDSLYQRQQERQREDREDKSKLE
ncbi:hypothetical protein RJT34_18449 [Clitoria ternatea]|uniref:Uncharacterized protein n=1 Tax=Clitoria ternatea TaxID=43366 RepID=A0AAN9JDZ7_CLITE